MSVVRWAGRIWAGALFLLWGAFFVEHLREWFMTPAASPPPMVVLLQAFHLLLLIGLVVGWKWELAGGLVTLASAVVFFGLAAGPRFVPFMMATAGPPIIWILLGLTRPKASPW